MYKIVYFSTSEFGIPILQSISSNKSYDVCAVITQPDKKAGRGLKETKTPIKEEAEKLGIPVLTPETLSNNEEFINLLKGLEPDFILTASYGLLIPNKILEIPKIASVNVHPSLLPKYRGASPIQSALLNGDKETGVSLIEMTKEMDAGDVYLVKRVNIEQNDDYITLEDKLAKTAGLMLLNALIDIDEGLLTKIKQNNDIATFCGKIDKESGKIDFKKETANQIINKIKAFKVWPGTFFKWDSKIVKLKDAEFMEENGKPGLAEIKENRLILHAAKNSLNAKILQMEGKKETDASGFINGYGKQIQANPELN